MAQTIKNVVGKNSGFFTDEFRRDAELLGKADDRILGSIQTWLEGLKNYDSYSENDDWIPLSKETGKTIDDLVSLLRPASFIASVCLDEKVEALHLLEALAAENIAAAPEANRPRVAAIVSRIVFLLNASRELHSTGSRLPLLKIKGIRTRCVSVSEFNEGFDVDRDEPQRYNPRVTKIHSGVTLELTFHDEKQHPLGIQLGPDDIRVFRRWLEFAEIQLKTTKATLAEVGRDGPVV